MIASIHDLIKQINPVVIGESPEKAKHFFVQYDKSTLKIISITQVPKINDTTDLLPIEPEVALKFLRGEENIARWVIGYKGSEVQLQKESDLENFIGHRTDLIPIVKINIIENKDYAAEKLLVEEKKKETAAIKEQNRRRLESIKRSIKSANFFPKNYWKETQIDFSKNEVGEVNYPFDVEIYIHRNLNFIEIKYNGDVVKNRSLKFYLTREDDPAHLKCAITLSTDVLDKIMDESGLSSWPNPVKIQIPGGTEDLSIYTLKSNLEIIAIGK